MSFQFTLRAARLSCGYTVAEAAKACKIQARTMDRYEHDSGEMPRRVALTLTRLYGVSMDMIYFGKESDCIKQNRDKVQADTVIQQFEEAAQ